MITPSVLESDFNNINRRIYKYNSVADTYARVTDSTNMSYFETTSVAGDAILFMADYRIRCPNRFKFNIGTPIDAENLVLKWYVGSKTSKQTSIAYPILEWIDITDKIEDETNGFTETGVKTVTLNAMKLAVLGRTGPLSDNIAANRNYWFKCEIESVDSITNGGANTTNQISWGSNIVTITGSYDERTIAGYSGSTVINAPSGTLTTNEYMGRAVWIPEHDNKWNKYPIRSNTTTGVVVGIDSSMAPASVFCRLNPDELPENGQTMVISHTMEDVLEACQTAGLDWVEGYGWNPIRNEHTSYDLTCEIVLDGEGKDYTFFSGFAQNYTLYGTCYIRVDGLGVADRAFTRYMFGIQTPTPTADGWTLSNGVVGLGCHIHYVSFRNQRSNPIVGDFNGCMYFAGAITSFQTDLDARDSNVFQSIFGGCQMSTMTNTIGNVMIHSPVAEPLRNPATSFGVSNFRAGWNACLYAVGTGPYTLDSPASTGTPAFTGWTSFTETGIANVIDKDPQTLFTCRSRVNANSTSGTFKFFFRLNVNVRGSDTEVTPIEGASITVCNKSGGIEFQDVTDSDGNATGNGDVGEDSNKIYYGYTRMENTSPSAQTISKNELDEVFGPYVVRVEKEGYETIVLPFTGDKRNDLVITMKRAIPVMTTTGSKVALKVDPTNITKNRGKLIVL
jgi:hypothetical protein